MSDFNDDPGVVISIGVPTLPPPSFTVVSGATESGLTVSSGGELLVEFGGTAVDATILAGGSAEIDGVDSATTISAGGSETVTGFAVGDIVGGTQVLSTTGAGVASETVIAGGTVDLAIKGTTATGVSVLTGGLLELDGNISATATVIDGGTVDLQSPKATLADGVTFMGAGTIAFTDTSSATFGDLAVIAGFGAGDVIDETVIAPGATLSTSFADDVTTATVTGGGITESLLFQGDLTSSLALQNDGTGGVEIVSGATMSGPAVTDIASGASATVTVSAGAANDLTVEAGGTLVNGTILSGGLATVLGVDSGTAISTGGTEIVSGSASGDSVFGTQLVSAATAAVSGETVANGGALDLFLKGASATDITVGNSGMLNLSGNVTATDTVLDGGIVDLESPKATLAGSVTFESPSRITVSDVASATFGDLAVISGFATGDSIDEATMGPGTTLSATTSGGNTVATVTSGGVSQSFTFSGDVTGNLVLQGDGAGGEAIGFATSHTTIPIISAFTPGDLVIGVSGDVDGSGSYTDNQATPIALEEIAPDGTVVGEMFLPQESSVVDGVTENAVSGEYGSSSEGTLQLTADGTHLVIMGYGINAQTYNAGGVAVYGDAALAQSTSLQGGAATPVTRVVASIGYDGSVDTSTALYDIDNGNNPRSVASVNGTSFYIAGQGQKGDTTQGVLVAQDGATEPTAIDTSTDTRAVEILIDQLYVSRDSTQGAGGTSSIATYGIGLPTGATTATVLPGLDGHVTLTAAQENTVNAGAVGSSVNLSPENYFFAGADTLYVADGGIPKEGGVGDGGLQKWALVGGTWTLQYTLSAGLDLVNNGSASGTTGLIGLTGTVTDGVATLYATNATIGDLDQTYLYSITDAVPAETPAPDASFTQLVKAAPDTNVRGIAFAPQALTPNTITDVPINNIVDNVVTSGTLTVEQGGTLYGADVRSGGSVLVQGADADTRIEAGASETVLGTATSDQVFGTQVVSAGSASVAMEDVYNGGAIDLFLKGASATDTIVFAGGALNISGNATATDTAISGGTINLESAKAVLAGGVTFYGTGGTIELTAASDAGFGDLAVISGFGAGDVVDETVLGAGTTMSTALSGGNTVATLTSGGTTGTLTFAGDVAAHIALGTDSTGGTEITYHALPCYAAGTRIRTPHGDIAIEVLKPGDPVTTFDGSTKPIRWIGRRHVTCTTHARPESVYPVRIAAHALGPNTPSRDLLLSPDHALYSEGALIPAKLLVNGTTVRQDTIDRIEYFHLELDHHNVIFAENLPAETYLETGNRTAFANTQATQLHPDFGIAEHGTLIWETHACAPLTVTGPTLTRLRDRLAGAEPRRRRAG